MSNSGENRTILQSLLSFNKDSIGRNEEGQEQNNKEKLTKISTGVTKDSPQDNMMALLSSENVTCMDVEEVERTFKTDVKIGLTNEEANQRRKTYGTNDFDAGEDDPLWKKFLNQV